MECWRHHSPEDLALLITTVVRTANLSPIHYTKTDQAFTFNYTQQRQRSCCYTHTHTHTHTHKIYLFPDEQKGQFCGDTKALLVNIIATYACRSKIFEDATASELVRSWKVNEVKRLGMRVRTAFRIFAHQFNSRDFSTYWTVRIKNVFGCSLMCRR
jgi:hypothetical protein